MIREFIEINFPVAKLRSDLFNYFEEMSFAKNIRNEYEVSVFNEDDLNIETKIISINDDLNIVSCSIECFFLRDISYHITVGIGDLIEGPKKDSLFTVDKCLAMLKYNSEFGLYDTEFYINNINRAK